MVSVINRTPAKPGYVSHPVNVILGSISAFQAPRSNAASLPRIELNYTFIFPLISQAVSKLFAASEKASMALR
jgi:hypothetical protein